MASSYNFLNDLWKNIEHIIFTLTSLWLNKNEIDIYLAALALWQWTSSILGKKVWLRRSTAQYICQNLVDKKLLSKIKKENYFLFWPESPDRFYTILKHEEEKIQRKKENINIIIDDLKGIMTKHHTIPKIKYYHWVNGVIEILENTLEEKSEIYGVLYIPTNVNPDIKNYVLTKYLEEKKKFRTQTYGILNDNKETRAYKDLDKKMNRVSLLIPKKDFQFGSCMQIYWNKVAFFSFEKNDLTGMIIEDIHIRKTQFSLFKASWKMAKELPINQNYKNITLW